MKESESSLSPGLFFPPTDVNGGVAYVVESSGPYEERFTKVRNLELVKFLWPKTEKYVFVGLR